MATKKELTAFEEECYRLLEQIPKGKVTTYKALAEALGSNGARAVGNACSKNPFAPKIPCHRVVKSDGQLGGYAFGINKKAKLLEQEGVSVSKNLKVDLKKHFYQF